MMLQISSINIGDKNSLKVLNILRKTLYKIKEITKYEGIISEDDGTYICDTNDILLRKKRLEGD